MQPAIYPLTCPYCGERAPAYQFLTPAQHAYVYHYARTLLDGLNDEMPPNTERKLIIDMDAVVDQEPGEPRPDFYHAAQTQQTRYRCEKCDDFNDIRGRYGYCGSCGARNNILSLEASLSDLRERLNGGQIRAEEVVRSAVSEFDACCRDFVMQIAKRIPMKPARRAALVSFLFHDVDSPAVATMRSMFDIDLLRGLADELSFIKMMMRRRHVFEHNAGVADDRYVRLNADPGAREGVLIRETQENAHRLISGLTKMARNFAVDFHEIFPLTEPPVRFHQEKLARRRLP